MLNKPTKIKYKKIKAWAIVWKHDNNIEEAYENFEMNDTFFSLKGARIYIKEYFNSKHGWKKGYFNKDLKVVPIVISIPLKTK